MDDNHTLLLDIYHDEARFVPSQQQLVQWLMPHLQEALKVNRRLAAPADKAVLSGALLIAEADGAIQHCAAQALTLMTSEWPAWHAVRLPRVLLDALRRTGVNRYVGKCIIAYCQRYRTFLLLRLAPRSRVMQLSRRELQVADLWQGHARKGSCQGPQHHAGNSAKYAAKNLSKQAAAQRADQIVYCGRLHRYPDQFVSPHAVRRGRSGLCALPGRAFQQAGCHFHEVVAESPAVAPQLAVAA